MTLGNLEQRAKEMRFMFVGQAMSFEINNEGLRDSIRREIYDSGRFAGILPVKHRNTKYDVTFHSEKDFSNSHSQIKVVAITYIK